MVFSGQCGHGNPPQSFNTAKYEDLMLQIPSFALSEVVSRHGGLCLTQSPLDALSHPRPSLNDNVKENEAFGKIPTYAYFEVNLASHVEAQPGSGRASTAGLIDLKLRLSLTIAKGGRGRSTQSHLTSNHTVRQYFYRCCSCLGPIRRFDRISEAGIEAQDSQERTSKNQHPHPDIHDMMVYPPRAAMG